MFSGTLRQNLDPFDQYSDDQVWAALEHSHLKTFVKGLAAGLQHEISEGGGNLRLAAEQGRWTKVTHYMSLLIMKRTVFRDVRRSH